VPEGVLHICYSHSPTHFYWRHYDQYQKRPGFGIFDPLARLGLRLLIRPLRRWDHHAASRPDYFIANSTHIQSDIKSYYGRDSVVIHPPVDTDRFLASQHVDQQRHGFITMGRQVPYKRTDIIIEACSKLGVPLTVIGRGPEHQRLVAMAGSNTTFLTEVSDADMPAHLRSATAFIFAAYEDFGIAPLEAMASGTPVIALRAGGALDYVMPGQTGVFFDEQNADSLAAVLDSFHAAAFDHAFIAKQAERFSAQAFRQAFWDYLEKLPERGSSS
jgi:glycosyltransferase involved in cell wall biosynthesis